MPRTALLAPLLLLLCSARVEAQQALPPLDPLAISPVARAFCMSEQSVMELTEHAETSKRRDANTLALLLKSSDTSVRNAAERMLVQASKGDAELRATPRRVLASCLIAGIPTLPERRALAIAWLRADAEAGIKESIRQLMTLTLLGEADGGVAAARPLYLRLPGAIQPLAGADMSEQILVHMHGVAAGEVMSRMVGMLPAEFGAGKRNAPGERQVIYHFCAARAEAAPGMPAALGTALDRLNARLRQLPAATPPTCTDAGAPEPTLPVRWTP